MFEPVLKSLVDFENRIVIKSDWRPMENDPTFSIEHEPQLTRDNCVQPLTGDLLEIWHKFNDQPAPSELFESQNRKTLLNVYSRLENGEYVVSLSPDQRKYWERDAANLSLPWDYVRQAVRAINDHPFWDDPAVGYKCRMDLT